MDIQLILTAITSVGFPIVMCLIFCWYINKMNESHVEESKGYIEAINSNTLVLQRLCDALDIEGVNSYGKE